MRLSLSRYVRGCFLFFLSGYLCLLVPVGHASSCPDIKDAKDKWRCASGETAVSEFFKEDCKSTYPPDAYICYFEKNKTGFGCEPPLPKGYYNPPPEVTNRPNVCVHMKHEEPEDTQSRAESNAEAERISVAFFCYNKSDLRKDAYIYLNALAICYQFSPYELKVIGHADVRGGEEYNRNLSWKRAYKVRNYLEKRMLKPVPKITPLPMGESAPKCHGKSIKDHAFNRRVEIDAFNNGDILYLLNQGNMLHELSMIPGEQQSYSQKQQYQSPTQSCLTKVNQPYMMERAEQKLFQSPTQPWSTSTKRNQADGNPDSKSFNLNNLMEREEQKLFQSPTQPWSTSTKRSQADRNSDSKSFNWSDFNVEDNQKVNQVGENVTHTPTFKMRDNFLGDTISICKAPLHKIREQPIKICDDY